MKVLAWTGVAAGLTAAALVAFAVAGSRLLETLDEPCEWGDL